MCRPSSEGKNTALTLEKIWDRQTDRQTSDRCYMLAALDAACSVISLAVNDGEAGCKLPYAFTVIPLPVLMRCGSCSRRRVNATVDHDTPVVTARQR